MSQRPLAPLPSAPCGEHTPPAVSEAPMDPSPQLDRLGELIASAHSPDPDLMERARQLTQAAGGPRLSPGHFCAALLDLADRIGRVPPTTWLSLCRGMALGASVQGEGSLPLPLRHAARRLLTRIDLPPSRRLALAEALMLGPL